MPETIHLISHMYVKGSVYVLNQVEKSMKVIIHFVQKQIFSVWKSRCLTKQPVMYRLECLYSVQTVWLPLIHVVLDFRWHAAGLSAHMSAGRFLLSFCHCICYLKSKTPPFHQEQETPEEVFRGEAETDGWCCSHHNWLRYMWPSQFVPFVNGKYVIRWMKPLQFFSTVSLSLYYYSLKQTLEFVQNADIYIYLHRVVEVFSAGQFSYNDRI